MFDLADEHVVHHKDKDHFNTMIRNFFVFTNNADHVKYHHEERQIEAGAIKEHKVVPVWDGGDYRGPEPFESVNGEKPVKETPKNVIKAVSDIPDRYRPPEFSGGVPKRKGGK